MKLAVALLFVAGVAHADDAPAYQLVPDVDVPVIATSALAVTPWFLELGPAYCAPQCDTSSIDALDKPFAGRYHPGWTTAGTIGAAALIASPPLVLLGFESAKHAANDTVVIAESVLVTSAIGVVFETGVRRPRPFLYGTSAPLADRMATNAGLSFFSGHTADSWAATIALWRTLDRLHVAPKWKDLVLGVGLAGSTFVAVSRVASGDHFPTDVIAGAGIGASIGWLVPALHRSGVAVAPAPMDTGWMMTAAARF